MYLFHRIAVVDTRNLQSEIVTIPVVACSYCSGHGQCDFNVTRKTEASSYAFATCNCYKGYSGLDCEEDKDGCAFQPCPQGARCLDSPAEVEAKTGLSYTCTHCPSGFILNRDKTKCQDVDECDNASNPVCGDQSACINTIGGFTCSCFEGFRLSKTFHCVDINECVENTHGCNQICLNTIGSYSCQCESGFSEKYKCQKFNDTSDTCAKLNKTCEYGCRNSTGECFCQRGKKLKQDGETCEDINECLEEVPVCSQICTNSDGNFSCSCYNGYKLNNDQISCDICPGITYGEKCKRTCSCLGRAVRCDNVKGCVCQRWWHGSNCEQDVDECAITSTCRADQICFNTNGSYKCICPNGYTETNELCSNINECLSPSINNCTQLEVCQDVPGAYLCVCQGGYVKTNNICQDIDECSLGISGCSHLCVNTGGSYNCECFPGYILEDDRKSCREKLDLCEHSYLNCSYGCTIQNETPQCICPTGHQLSTNKQDCLDINECMTRKNLCTGVCINTLGSYNCSCYIGTKLQNDQRSCIECDNYHWGHDCVHECNCSLGGSSHCNPITGCVCRPGWAGLTCSNDIDECSAMVGPCPGISNCINTPGSYLCQCRAGYQLKDNSCVDIDECSGDSLCDYQCTNTVGSFYCSCPPGFRVEGYKCADIDECAVAQLNNCDQLCRNTIGKFACECRDGYVRNASSNSCDLINVSIKCEKSKNICNQTCTLEVNKTVCSCRPGYTLADDGFNCNDVDECQDNPCVTGSCLNYDGAFSCHCDVGFKLLEDQLTCAECRPGFYGRNCSYACPCISSNVKSCNSTDGSCSCFPGWNGASCMDDIDECSNTTMCPPNSHCINSPGSYRCVCNIGLYSSEGICLACDADHFGQDCSQKCGCVPANTLDCSDRDGTCICKQGMSGTYCEVGIEECAHPSFCKGPHENCTKLNGSDVCECTSGYERNYQDGTCQDINECLHASLNNCVSPRECKNTDGSKLCVCKPGYLAAFNDSCQAHFREFPLQIRLDYPDDLITSDLFDTQTNVFKSFAFKVEATLQDFCNNTIGRACLSVKVSHLTKGSLIVNTALRIDKVYSSNTLYDAALLARNLLKDKSLLIGDQVFNVTDVGLNNVSVSISDDICQVYNTVKEKCPVEICLEYSLDKTICSVPPEDDDHSLIIGLAVGIPLFVMLIIFIIVVWCVRKKFAQ